MTEDQWLSSTDPAAILKWLTGDAVYEGRVAHLTRAQGERKLRLFVEECRRRWWPEASRGPKAEDALRWVVGDIDYAMPHPRQPEVQAHLLREIFGNPFRPVTLPLTEEECPECCGRGTVFHDLLYGDYTREPCDRCGGLGMVAGSCPWLTSDVLAIARCIREGKECPECRGKGRVGKGWKFDAYGGSPVFIEKCPSCHGTGRVDAWGDMPILGDALETAGCTNEEILAHCRGKERCIVSAPSAMSAKALEYGCAEEEIWTPLRVPHVAGCWVIDLVLGEE